MPALDLRQVCWNHETREAVCRCPQCARSFCRECVTEHEGRFLCAACLREAPAAEPRGRVRGPRWVLPALMLAGGFLLAWVIFFAMGESILGLLRKMTEPGPQSRLWTLHG